MSESSAKHLMSEVNGDSSPSGRTLRRQKSFIELLTRDELLEKLREYRQANIELLDEKRHLLLRSQEAFRIEVQLDQTKEEVRILRERLQNVESDHAARCDDATTQTIKELVRQISTSSRRSNDDSSNVDGVGAVGVRLEGQETRTTVNTNMSVEPDFSMFEDADNVADVSADCTCGLKPKLDEVMKVNHHWQMDYNTLLDELNRTKDQLRKVESQLRVADFDRIEMARKLADMQQDVSRAVSRTESADLPSMHNQRNMPSLPPRSYSSDIAMDSPAAMPTVDDIEALKQQMIVYKEDFDSEKRDNENLTADNNRLKLELQKAYAIIDDLTNKANNMKENYRRVSSEKQHIISELRRLSSTSILPFSPVSTERQQRSGSADFDSLTRQDVIPHSGRRSYRPSYADMQFPIGGFYGGPAIRDGAGGGHNTHKADDGGYLDSEDGSTKIVDDAISVRPRSL